MKYICSIKGEEIPVERAEFLLGEGRPSDQLTCIKCATTKRRQGLSIDDELVVVQKVYNDSVRGVFKASEEEHEEVGEEEV